MALAAPADLPASPPLIIGATGGSGTRVVARIARLAGYDLGSNLNRAGDARDFVPLHDAWINQLLRSPAEAQHFPEALTRDFRDALAKHLAGCAAPTPTARWGWKAPRSIYLLPFLRAEFGRMKFIHVLRDGRDMALSKNQNQLRKHGRAVLRWPERWLLPRAVRSILLWDRVNGRAADFGEAHLGESYLRVRFEDLCTRGADETARILQFLDSTANPEEIAGAEIRPPSTMRRWQSQPARVIARMEAAGDTSLRRFGYADPAS